MLMYEFNRTCAGACSQRKAENGLNTQFDKMKLREKTDFVIDTSDKFIRLPPGIKEKPVGDYIVAKVPPTCKLCIVPDMKPEYFTEEGLQYMAGWANWGHVTRSEDNRFYFSIGDHKGMGCHLNLYEYTPARNLLYRVLDVSKLLGWTDKTYTDGKIHGYMRIMPDGTLWAATHFGAIPDSSWYANGYRGSWLLSYNIFTHEAKNWGNPLAPSNLPCFNVDTRRGRMVANGDFGTILCWDTIEKEVLYAGCPPEGWIWWDRTMFLDEETGVFWSVEGSSRKLLPVMIKCSSSAMTRNSTAFSVTKYHRPKIRLPIKWIVHGVSQTLRRWTDGIT